MAINVREVKSLDHFGCWTDRYIVLNDQIMLLSLFGTATRVNALKAVILKGEVEIYLSPLIFSNLFYILRKMTTRPKAGETLKKLRSLIHILPIDDKIIDQALHSEFPDLEDAIQYFTALDNNIPILITRNKRDYKLSAISVNTAAEFLDSR